MIKVKQTQTNLFLYSNLSTRLRIILVAISANLVNFALGTCFGWTSPVILKLRNQTFDNPLQTTISYTQEGWLTSNYAIGSIIMTPFTCWLGNRLGRKWMIIIGSILIEASYVLMFVANDIKIMYTGRLLQGISASVILPTVSIYVGEIATNDCRGIVGSLLTAIMVGGIICVYAIGPYVTYISLQCYCMLIPLISFSTFIFMPESPYFCAIKGNKKELLKSLKFLRNESNMAIKEEMDQIQTSVDQLNLNKSSVGELFRHNKKALIICCGLMIFQQSTGVSAVTFNSQSIFTSVNQTLDPAIATIILGLAQLFSNLITPFVIERVGRKTTLLISASGMCLTMFILGTFFYVQKHGNASNVIWIPITSLISFNILYAFGFGPIPWTLLGEMFPSNVNAIASCFVCEAISLALFAETRWFSELNALAPYYSFWIFACFGVFGIIFIKFVVIETKGLSFQQIQKKLHP